MFRFSSSTAIRALDRMTLSFPHLSNCSILVIEPQSASFHRWSKTFRSTKLTAIAQNGLKNAFLQQETVNQRGCKWLKLKRNEFAVETNIQASVQHVKQPPSRILIKLTSGMFYELHCEWWHFLWRLEPRSYRNEQTCCQDTQHSNIHANHSSNSKRLTLLLFKNPGLCSLHLMMLTTQGIIHSFVFSRIHRAKGTHGGYWSYAACENAETSCFGGTGSNS